MLKLFPIHLTTPHPCLGFLHEARLNGLILLIILAVAVSVTVIALSRPK
jgi:hypothetical protein